MSDETARVSIVVDASPKQVWDALVDPVAIKKYFMGTTATTDGADGWLPLCERTASRV